MTSFLFLLCLFLVLPVSMRAQERKGKERKGEAGKRPPQSSRNSPGIHDKTRERRACRSPPPLLSFAHRGRQKGKEDGRAKGGPFAPAFLLLFHSFPFPLLSEKKQQREETKRGEERRRIWRRGRNPLLPLSLPSYRSSLFHFHSLILSLLLSLSLSLALTLHFSFLPLMRFLIDKETGKKDWERNAPPATPRRGHFLRIRVQKLKSRKQERRK